MAKYVGPKDRLSRREGFDLFGAGAKLTRLQVPPGVHGPKGTKGSSQYGRQLREKQKVKRLYGVLEKQFRRYVEEAFRVKGNTGVAILISLEKRLDNVIYRLGFAPSRPASRQLVSHGHALVNGKKVNIPSYKLVVGDTISIDSTAFAIPEIKKHLWAKFLKILQEKT
jgi:small subunit ribosomal protein S4